MRDIAGGDAGQHGRTLGAAFELAALVERERNLVRRNLAGADAAFDAQPTRRKHERLAIGFRFQTDRPHRTDQAERDVNDVIAGRQHDVRGRAALLADQLERAGIVRLVGEHPPNQPAIDDRQILAVARRQRQHRLVRSWRARRAARPAEPWRSTAARWWAGSTARESSGSRRARRVAPDSVQVRSVHPEPGQAAPAVGGPGTSGQRPRPAAARPAPRQAPAPGETSQPARVPRNRCPLKSWPCFSPKTRQIQASDGEFGAG